MYVVTQFTFLCMLLIWRSHEYVCGGCTVFLLECEFPFVGHEG